MKEVCVLYGGNSSEREVSLKSGKFIHKSLVKNGYKSHLIDYADLTELEKLKDFNLVFIALHGEEGESGILQSKWIKQEYTIPALVLKLARIVGTKKFAKIY